MKDKLERWLLDYNTFLTTKFWPTVRNIGWILFGIFLIVGALFGLGSWLWMIYDSYTQGTVWWLFFLVGGLFLIWFIGSDIAIAWAKDRQMEKRRKELQQDRESRPDEGRWGTL